jgi:predicted RNA-binding protein YlxR (DUF448 family)
MTKVKQSALPARHVPRRTCIACRKTGGKRELVRLVCSPEGKVEVDLTGKKSGRGAYLCPAPACWESACNTGKLAYALRTKIKPDNVQELEIYAKKYNSTDC